MSNHFLRVTKLGGSLLDWELWPERLTAWLAAQQPARNILIVGGGPLANAIRHLDDKHKLSGEAAHFLAVRTLTITAHFVASLMKHACVIDQLEDTAMLDDRSIAVLDPLRFLLEREPQMNGCRLPRDWSVTSDSIAARAAQFVQADELVLIKSTLPDACRDWQAAADAGYVDTYFPSAVQPLRAARCVNLRNPQILPWQPHRVSQDC